MGGEPLDAGEHERAVVRALAAGRIGALRDLAGRGRQGGRDDLVALLARTDARARGFAADVPEIEAVLERIERGEPPGSRLRAWGQAVLAERLLLEPDPACVRVADQALDELAGRQLPPRQPLALRYARARLRRVASLGWLFPPTTLGRGDHLRLRDEAVAELLACNLVEEVHLSRGLDAGLSVVMADDEIVENYTRLLDARAGLDEGESDAGASVLPAMLDVFVGLVAFEVGDFEASLSAFDRLEAAPALHPRVQAVVDYGRAFFRLVTGGATPPSLRVMERALSEVRRYDPRTAQTWHGQVAHTLADNGSREAERLARFEWELPAAGPVQEVGRQVLRWRLATLAGEPVPTDDALAALVRLESLGFRRRAGRLGLRLAHDLARAGDMEAAARLHTWARPRLPRGRRLTIWERWWSRPVEGSPAWESVPFAPVTTPASRRVGTASRRDGEPGVDVEVMVPALAIRVDGEPVALSNVQAKLVLALAVAHPVPLHVERASDLLWPDEALAATRYRLNSLVYRLRHALGPHGTAVVRRGDLLHLDPDHCDVDLWRLRRALVKGTPERVEALAAVKSNLCEAQFPYDEPLVDERHRVCAELIAQARAAVRAGEASPAELEPLALALDLTPDDLAG